MNNKVTIGIDIGTTYIKGILLDSEEGVLASARNTSQHVKVDNINSFVKPIEYWNQVKEIITELIRDIDNPIINSINISAISTCITVFEQKEHGRSISLPYWELPKENTSSFQYLNNWRFNYILKYCNEKKFRNVYLTDLVGFINWKLTDITTMNIKLPFSKEIRNLLYEFKYFNKPKYCNNQDIIGKLRYDLIKEFNINKDVFIIGGCPDSIASIYGSGIDRQNYGIYLGTFGSLYKTNSFGFRHFIKSKDDKFPIDWLLSVPNFGPNLEAFCNKMFPGIQFSESINLVQEYALKSKPGANGNFFILLRWDKNRNVIGSLEYIGDGFEPNSKENICRAFLESFAYAVNASNFEKKKLLNVSGGGTKNLIWMNILSIVLDTKLYWRRYNWDALGTAEIAQHSLDSEYVQYLDISYSVEINHIKYKYIEIIKNKTKSIYNELDR